MYLLGTIKCFGQVIRLEAKKDLTSVLYQYRLQFHYTQLCAVIGYIKLLKWYILLHF